jgi:hypothetical protein
MSRPIRLAFRAALPCLLSLLLLALPAAAADAHRIVVWAPGYPGNTEQAQETMDDFAATVSAAAKWKGALSAVYHQTIDEGVAALTDGATVLALVPAPVLHRYGDELGLEPLLQVVPETGSVEVWSLVAKRGRVSSPASLHGFQLVGVAGYAPEFVRGPALGAWGELPASTQIDFTSRVRSALRRAAAGEDIAVLADSAQAGALGALPFATDLEIVARSSELPSSYVCSVKGRLDAEALDRVRRALLSFGDSADGRETLASMRMERFDDVDDAGLASLRAAGSR